MESRLFMLNVCQFWRLSHRIACGGSHVSTTASRSHSSETRRVSSYQLELMRCGLWSYRLKIVQHVCQACYSVNPPELAPPSQEWLLFSQTWKRSLLFSPCAALIFSSLRDGVAPRHVLRSEILAII